MQTQIGIGGVATALLTVLWCQAGLAQGNCGDIQFSSDITSRFPNARNACLGVVRRDGQEFAHFQGRIRQVRGNTVEAEFKLPNGEWGRPVSFETDANARIRIQGQTYRYRDLSRGQELDVYLPADRWAIAVAQDPSTDFENAPAVTLVALQEPAPSVASAALPRTASILPLLGLLGAVLTGLGAAVATVRRKL
jgi:hypothetical protein